MTIFRKQERVKRDSQLFISSAPSQLASLVYPLITDINIHIMHRLRLPTMPKTCIRPQLQTRLISTPSQPKPIPARAHQKPQKNDLRILPATPGDSPAIADVFLHAFSDPFSRRMFPITEDVRSWWVDQFRRDIEESQAATPSTAFLKVTAGEDGTVAAFAKWWYPASSETLPKDGEKHQTKIVWPPSSDADLCERFFNLMNNEKQRVMGGREEGYFCELSFYLLRISLGTADRQTSTCWALCPSSTAGASDRGYCVGGWTGQTRKVCRPSWLPRLRDGPFMRSMGLKRWKSTK